jgi:hypothetical protein
MSFLIANAFAFQKYCCRIEVLAFRAMKKFLHTIWPPMMIAVGLGLTAAWTGFLGYQLAHAALSIL